MVGLGSTKIIPMHLFLESYKRKIEDEIWNTRTRMTHEDKTALSNFVHKHSLRPITLTDDRDVVCRDNRYGLTVRFLTKFTGDINVMKHVLKFFTDKNITCSVIERTETNMDLAVDVTGDQNTNAAYFKKVFDDWNEYITQCIDSVDNDIEKFNTMLPDFIEQKMKERTEKIQHDRNVIRDIRKIM